jgi:hypothetical protein
VRHESEAMQHNEAVPSEASRLKEGRDEPMRSLRRLWNSVLPIFGLVVELAPDGAQIVYPS